MAGQRYHFGDKSNYTDKIFQCNLEDSELIPSLTQEVTEAQKKNFELEKAINLDKMTIKLI
jgi:hypothetical protein